VRLERVPLESREPIVAFAIIRALIAAAALAAVAILGFPFGGDGTAVLTGVLLWALAGLYVTRRSPEAGLSPLVAAGDIAVLGVLQAVEPETYGPVHFTALFLVAVHAHFQGEQRGLLVGAVAAAVLVPVSLATDVPLDAGTLHFYEALFAVYALSVALVVGSLRTAESSGRVRARALSRRAIDTEAAVRRRLAEQIHDGPIQELSSVELMLASADQALDRGDTARGRDAIRQARAVTRDNITFLRDEIVELGPHAFEERSFDEAISDCAETWRRRHGFELELDIAPDPLPPEVAGALFRITQEAVANAGKHAHASTVAIRLRREGSSIVLEVADDGRGFGDLDPLGASEPGHIGLASMRERAEMLGGRLAIDDRGDRSGTRVRVSVPV
jgi:signal transduction histidine kinase